MSATPIPRSLALALHGDLDASFLTERPAGRAPAAATCVRGADERRAAYARLREAVAEGRQAFVVCPVREVARRDDAVTAVAQHARLLRELRPARVGLLHGGAGRRRRRRRTLRAFAAGAPEVLVATTVVELGIDVPNATVMIVEEADRFGVAQLHQLRGRVGRGTLAGDLLPVRGRRRAHRRGARAARRWWRPTDDGFALAEADLAQRGAGDLFGTRQAGDAALVELGSASTELAELLQVARREAEAVLAADPALAAPEHAAARARRGARSAADAVRGRRGMTSVWVLAGIVGGAIAGLVDAGVAIAGGIGGMSVGKAIRLVALSASLLAAAGGIGGLLIAAGDALVRADAPPGALGGRAVDARCRAARRLRRVRAVLRPRAAASIPAHGAISVGAASSAGLAAVALAALALRAALGRRAPRALAARAGARRRGIGGRRREPLGAAAALRLVPRDAVGGDAGARSCSRRACGCARSPRASGVARRWSRRRGVRGRAVRAAHQPGDALRGPRAHGAGRAGAARRPDVACSRARVAAAERHAAEVALPPLPDGPRRPEADVLLITVDALRADHVGAYGYPRATTPNIDALAARGTRFTRAYAQAPHTSFSVASMLTGKYFPTLARLAPGERHEPLAAVLRTYGWRTAAFYPPAVFFVDSHKLKSYAETNFDFEYVKFEYIDANKRVEAGASRTTTRCSRGARSSGSTSSSRTSRTSSTRASRSAAATSIATTARSPTPTRPSGG